MAGSVPCLPSTSDTPVVLSGIGNELRTDLLLTGQATRLNWPTSHQPATNAVADGGNPLRKSPNAPNTTDGLWAYPYPFGLSAQTAAGGRVYELVAIGAGTITDFFSALTLGFSNPSPYTIAGDLSHAFHVYLAGESPKLRYFTNYTVTGGATLESTPALSFSDEIDDALTARRDWNQTYHQVPQRLVIPPRTNITVSATVNARVGRAVAINTTTLSAVRGILSFTGVPVS